MSLVSINRHGEWVARKVGLPGDGHLGLKALGSFGVCGCVWWTVVVEEVVGGGPSAGPSFGDLGGEHGLQGAIAVVIGEDEQPYGHVAVANPAAMAQPVDVRERASVVVAEGLLTRGDRRVGIEDEGDGVLGHHEHAVAVGERRAKIGQQLNDLRLRGIRATAHKSTSWSREASRRAQINAGAGA
ncbi:MAG: hypothetical protein IPO67_01095 [Deltaproteobacteria bacterium]|nr:hypothetical protein [Deltaproteobacteria bacterium]